MKNKKAPKFSIDFYPEDKMLLLHLQHQDNPQAYIKKLIEKDMLDFESVRKLQDERIRELGKRNYIKSEKDLK